MKRSACASCAAGSSTSATCATARAAAVINETMASSHWADQDSDRATFGVGAAATDPGMTIVGIVGDVRQMGLAVPADPEFFMPLDQTTTPFMWPRQIVVRTAGDPLALAPALRRAIWAVDPASRCRACAR